MIVLVSKDSSLEYNMHLNDFSLKIHEKFQLFLNKMTSERGLWNVEHSVEEFCAHAILKIEDPTRRRVFVKPHPKIERLEYMDLSTYQKLIKEMSDKRKANPNLPAESTKIVPAAPQSSERRRSLLLSRLVPLETDSAEFLAASRKDLRLNFSL